MVFNDEIRELIMNRASTNVLRVAAQKNGMRLLRENGLAAIYDGITTIDEVVERDDDRRLAEFEDRSHVSGNGCVKVR